MKRFKRIMFGLMSLTLIMLFAIVSIGCSSKGITAYEIAVENGFIGTEQEWLKSLQGKDGQSVVQLDIYEIYEQFKQENPDVSFEEFLSLYLNVSTSSVEIAASIAVRSTVSIFCKFTTRPSGSSGRVETFYSAGSGVIYSLDKVLGSGYIITNYHVVHNSDSNTSNRISNEISVYFYGREYDGFGVKAEFVGGSAQYDIAVLKISGVDLSNTIAAQVELGDSNNVDIGQNIIAVGNPSGSGLSVVAGIISVDSEQILMESIIDSSATNYVRVIRIDAPVNGGNSGGGLFNAKGQLLGIVNAKTVEEDIEGMCYAIPLSTAIGVAKNVIDGFNKKVRLGIVTTIEDSKAEYDQLNNKVSIVETIKITEVESDSISAGLLQVGDYLRSIKINDGEEFDLTRSFHLSDYLFKPRTGDTITIKLLRNGVEMSVQLTVVESKLIGL